MGCGASIEQQNLVQNQNSQQDSDKQFQQQQFNTGQKLTLNICTINLGEYQSPFKLYHRSFKRLGMYDQQQQQQDQEQEQRQLNNVFVQVSELYKHNIKQKYINQNLIKLEKITKQRYTPLYRKDVGVNIKNYTLMSQRQFDAEWQRQFSPLGQAIKNDPSHKFDICRDLQEYQLAKLQLKKFDTICYHTIIAYVYKNIDLSCVIRQNLAHKYCLIMNSKFSKNQFDVTQKIKNIQNFMRKLDIDIAFVHQITGKYLDRVRQQFSSYRIVQPIGKMTCAIFVKGELINKLEPKYKNYTLNGLNQRYVDIPGKSNLNTYFNSEQRRQTAVLAQIRKRKQRNQILKKMVEIQKKQQDKIDIKQMKADSNSTILRRQGAFIKQSNMLATLTKPKKDQLNQSMLSENQDTKPTQLQNDKTDQSKIILSKKNKLVSQELSYFKLNQDSVIQFVGCFILISMKINQFIMQKDKRMKSSVNIRQVQRIKNLLMQLRKKFPKHKIILGLNTPVSKDQMTKDQFIDHMQAFRQRYKHKQQPFCFIPDVFSLVENYQQQDKHMIGKQKLKRMVQKKGFFTSIYKKTNFNIDSKQINYEYTGVDSFLISNCKLQNEAIYNCKGEQISGTNQFKNIIEYIPNQNHPFASLFIFAKIQVQLLEVVFNQD